MQRFAAGRVIFRRQHGQDGRIQSAGQETRQRHIADQLTAGGIADERVRVLDGSRQVVLMLVRLELPVGVIGEGFRRKNRKMPGHKGENLPKTPDSGGRAGPSSSSVRRPSSSSAGSISGWHSTVSMVEPKIRPLRMGAKNSGFTPSRSRQSVSRRSRFSQMAKAKMPFSRANASVSTRDRRAAALQCPNVRQTRARVT